MLLTDAQKQAALNETEMHKMVSNHENVVKLYDTIDTPTEYQMFMEYCNRPTYFSDKILEVSLAFLIILLETYTYQQQYEIVNIRRRHS